MRAALWINPDDIASARNLATALIDSGDMGAALAECTEERAAADPSLHIGRLRGYLLQEAGDHAAAAKAYSLVVARVPADFESWNNMGNALASAGDGQGSIDALRRAVALRPDVAPTYMNLSAALISGGQTDDAIKVLKDYAGKFPGDPRPLIELGSVFQVLGRNAEALALFTRTALDRGIISTASYSQVTEPIYSRATGRWERYREHLSEVLPILVPWAERFGYRP